MAREAGLRKFGHFAEDVVEVELDFALVDHFLNWHQVFLRQKAHQSLGWKPEQMINENNYKIFLQVKSQLSI